MEFLIVEDQPHNRLDHFVSEQNLGLSRTQVQRLIKSEHVLVNSKKSKASYVLRKDDRVSVEIPPPAEINVKPEKIPLDIVYEDSDLLVVNKPQGMVTHPAVGHYSGTLVNALLSHCKDLSGIGGELKPGIVHRLDKDTSGLLLVAKNDFTHQSLAQQIKDHKVEKVYLALVHGVLEQKEGMIKTKYGRHPVQRQKMAVLKDTWISASTMVREAITHFKVLKKFQGYSLVELLLETGRTHQIRVHLAYLGYPIVGDLIYGRRKNELGIKAQLLHSKKIKFVHPRTNKILEFTAEIPLAMKQIISGLEDHVAG